jgi:hypothetical protein
MAEEKDLRAKLAKLGVGTDEGFSADKLSPEIRKAVTEGMAEAWDAFDAFKKSKIDTGSQQIFAAVAVAFTDEPSQ